MEQEYKLPVKPEKLFSNPNHFHIKRAIKNQNDFLQLAKQGDENAIVLRNMIIATMKEAKITWEEAMVFRYYLSGNYVRSVVALFVHKKPEDIDRIAQGLLDRMFNTFHEMMAE